MPRTAVLLALIACLMAAPVAHGAGSATFTNSTGFPIPSSGNVGDAIFTTVVPSGIWGPVTDVNVKLDTIDHTNPDDLDVLVANTRKGVIVMSDVCGISDVSGFEWTFDDEDPTPVGGSFMSDEGQCLELTYKPTNVGGGDTWGLPPTSDRGSTLAHFDGLNPLRPWELHIADDASGSTGVLHKGWSLTITTGDHTVALPGAEPAGPGSPYPHSVAHGPTPGQVIADVNVVIRGLSHARAHDVDLMLEGPRGQKAMIVSDACGFSEFVDHVFTYDDEASGQLSANDAECAAATGTWRPVDYEAGETMPAPAPPPPYGTSLSVFDGTDPQGDWKLWAQDDDPGFGGYTTLPFQVAVTTRAAVTANWTTAAHDTAEGATATLTIARGASAGRGPATVRVKTADGTATGGGDFTPRDQVVSFDSGESEKSVSVPIADDAVDEGPETFTVALSEPTGDAAVASPSVATVTIAASDPSQAPPPGGTPAPGETTTPPAGGIISPPVLVGAMPLPGFTPFRMRSARRCVRRGRRIRFTPALPLPVALTRTEVRVNGRRALLRTGARADDPFRLRMRRRMRVVILATTADGRTLTQRRTYRRCPRA